MSDAVLSVIPHEVYSDLLGVPFERHGRTMAGLDCYGLVAEMFARSGITIPDHARGAAEYLEQGKAWSWTPTDEGPGAVGILPESASPYGAHLCFAIGDGLCIESCFGVGVTVTRTAGRGFKWLRWTPGEGVAVPQLLAGHVTVVEMDPQLNRTVRLVPWREGLTREDIAPNGHVMYESLADGGLVVAVTCPGFGLVPLAAAASAAATAAAAAAAHAAMIAALNTLLVNIVISAAMMGLSMLLQPSAPKLGNQTEAENNEGYFDLSGLKNTSGIGYPQALTYGETRVAGHIVGAFQRSVENGALDTSSLHLLFGFGVGPFERIGKNHNADADYIQAAQLSSDITIDGNPASSYQGTTAHVRMGNNDHAAVPEFSHTVQNVSYSNQFDGGESFVHVMTDAVDRYDVHIAFPQGLYSINSASGSTQARSVTHTIEHRIQGTTTWGFAHSFTTSRAKRVPFLVTHHMFPSIKAKYEVRITRTTAWPNSDSNIVDGSTLWGINEITHSSVALVGRPLLGITIVGHDQLTAAIPNVTAVVKGRKVWTWSTGAWVDDETAAVQHSWPTSASEAQLQGTATSGNIVPQHVYCDNPAMVALDLLLNTQAGMGRNGRITLANIDLVSFIAWANNCDQMVSDGRGGTTRRARFAGTIDGTTSGWEWLSKMAASHWARLMIVGNKIKVVVEKVTTPVYAFSAANVRDVLVQYHGRSTRPNTVEVQYLNRETDYEPDVATRMDDNAIFVNNEAQVTETVQAVGVVRASQAYRLAMSRTLIAKLATQSLSFTAGPESVHLLPGDVIWFGHECIQAGTGGRILAATSTTVTLDHSLTVSGGTGRITCRTSGDVIEERTLTNGTYARGAPITITSAWTSTPSAGAPYLAGAATTYRKTFRIEAIDTEPDLRRKITASLYADGIYSDDPGTIETFTDPMPDVRALPAAASEVWASDASLLREDGSTDAAIRVEWTTPTTAAHLYLRELDAVAWQSKGRWTGGEALLCCGVVRGTTYEVSVVPVGLRGQSIGGPDAGSIARVVVAGGAGVPSSPDALTVSLLGDRIVARLAAPCDRAHSYEWRYGATWAGSVFICRTPHEWLDIVPPFGKNVTLRVKARSASGVYSTSESTFANVSPSPVSSVAQLDLSVDEGGAGWTGTKTNTAVSGSSVILSGANSGTYETGSLVPYLDGQRQSIRVDAICGVQATHYRWDDACFQWGNTAHAADTWAAPHMTGHEYEHGLTWDQHGETWGCDHNTFANWGDTQDFVAALTPTVEVKENGGSYAVFNDSKDNTTLSSVQVKVTINRPHSRYEPEIHDLYVSTRHYSMTEPERITFEFTAGSATGAGGVVHGFNDSTSTGNTLKVPTGKILTVLSAIGVVTTGAAAGTYTASVIIRNITDGTNVTLASASTTSVSTRLHIRADGTRIAPLGTLAAGKEYQVGWLNAGTSPGALTSTNHHVRIVAVEETA